MLISQIRRSFSIQITFWIVGFAAVIMTRSGVIAIIIEIETIDVDGKKSIQYNHGDLWDCHQCPST